MRKNAMIRITQWQKKKKKKEKERNTTKVYVSVFW